MAFDIKTAKPVSGGGKFDITTAKPVTESGFDPTSSRKLDIIDNMVGMTPEDMNKKGDWISAGAQQTAKDVFSIPGEFFNQAAAGLVRPAMRHFMGTDIPEPESTTAKVVKSLAGGAGFIAGTPGRAIKTVIKSAEKVIPKLAQKGLMQSMVKGGLGGAVGGAALTPEDGGTDIINLPKRADQAMGYGVLGAALPVVGAAGKLLGKLPKGLSGLSERTMDAIKRLGGGRVFEPTKADPEFIGKAVVPQAKERIANIIANGNPQGKYILKNIGAKPEEIEALNKVSTKTLNTLFSKNGTEWQDIKTGIDAVKQDADNLFRNTIKYQPEDKMVNIKKSYYQLKTALVREGWIDKKGEPLPEAGVANKTKSNLFKIYKDLEKTVLGKPIIEKTGVLDQNGNEVVRKIVPKNAGYLPIRAYFNKLSELEATIVNNPKFDRLVYEAQGSLRKAAEGAIPHLKEANKAYSDAKTLLDLEPTLAKVLDSKNLQDTLLRLKNATKYIDRDRVRGIIGQRLSDDLEAHFAHQEWLSKKPSLSSPLQSAGKIVGRGLIKGGEAIRPVTNAVSKAGNATTEGVKNIVRWLQK